MEQNILNKSLCKYYIYQNYVLLKTTSLLRAKSKSDKVILFMVALFLNLITGH